jgi:AraC-like DNA-binding protein
MTATTSPTPSASAIPLGRPKSINHSAKCKPRVAHQAVIEKIEQLRRQRWTGKQIAVEVGVSSATVSRVLRRLGLNKLNALEPAEPVRRYERENPGELIHLDIKSSVASVRLGTASLGDRSALMRINIWIILGTLLAFLAITRYMQHQGDTQRSCANDPTASVCER